MFKKMSKREERLKEIEWAYRIRKLNDNRNFLGDSCEDCKKLLVKHQGVKVLIDDFSKVEIKYMKDLCIDCAGNANFINTLRIINLAKNVIVH